MLVNHENGAARTSSQHYTIRNIMSSKIKLPKLKLRHLSEIFCFENNPLYGMKGFQKDLKLLKLVQFTTYCNLSVIYIATYISYSGSRE